MAVHPIHPLVVTSESGLRQETAPGCRPRLGRADSTLPMPQQTLPADPVSGRRGSVFAFALNRYYWSPARLVRNLWGIATNIPRQLQILRIMKYPIYAEFLRNDPRFRFKFLIRDYLVRGLSTGQRAACFLHHYKRLHSSLSADLLHRILHRRITVYETTREHLHFEIHLSFSRPFEKEGELSLHLLVDGKSVFVLSFTIVPGWVVRADAEGVLLISRLQGTSGYYPQIRAATRALHDVAPAALLLATLHGIAAALGIKRMAAVSAVRQSSYTEELGRFYRSAYDDFFSEIGIPLGPDGFFLSPMPHEERPLSSIKQGHKIRTREKRQFKRHVADEVCQRMQQGLRLRDAELLPNENSISVVKVIEL